jgi:hypothetical protein
MRPIGIVGAGVVGSRVARMLDGHRPLAVYDRSSIAARALAGAFDQVETLGSTDSLDGCDVVVLANPVPHGDLVGRLLRSGVHVVSVAGDMSELRQLLEFDELARQHGVTLTAGAGMSPGLSGLIARWLAESVHTLDEIHVAVHGTAGPACAREHHRSLGSRAAGWIDGAWVERTGGSGRELCWFPEPVGAYDCYRAELVDPITLHATFPTASRISARVSATRRDRLTARLPMLRPPHREGGIGALRVEVRGADAQGRRITLIAGIAELVGTAAGAAAAAFADLAATSPAASGVVIPGDTALPTTALLDRIRDFGVRVQAFTGVPTPGES